VKVSGTLASVAVASRVFNASKTSEASAESVPFLTGENLPDEIESADDIIYSVCQMCHSRCGIRAKVKEGILIKLDGNPYHPNNRDVDENNEPDRVSYETPPEQAFTELGRLCLKGQAGVQTLYDPFRIQHPLKRVGPRNSGRWETISWDQAFSEIAAKIRQLIPNPDALIDEAIPELGKKKNLLGFAPGRSVEKEMSERIWKHGWGTANYGLSHTSVCESTRHVANELITWDPAGSKNSMGGGRTEGWQPDTLGAEYIIFFGANPLEADFPMVGMARNLMQFKRNGGKYVTVDPRFNNTAAQADQWVPITPGTDAALAMGMMSWILESNAHHTTYLENTNREASTPALMERRSSTRPPSWWRSAPFASTVCTTAAVRGRISSPHVSRHVWGMPCIWWRISIGTKRGKMRRPVLPIHRTRFPRPGSRPGARRYRA
jgi:anaerobic selenocysteine-containing dehydrogenase